MALALLVGLFVAYGSTRQGWLYNDGWQLVTVLSRAGDRPAVWMHVLYLPAAWCLERVLHSTSVGALELLSQLSGAVAVVALYLYGRISGVGRAAALGGAAIFALAPAVWFFATTIEIHAFHAACVALSMCLIAVAAKRSESWLGLALFVAVNVVYLSHKTGALLWPGLFVMGSTANWREWGSVQRGLVLSAVGMVGATVALALAAILLGNPVGGAVVRTAGFIDSFRTGWNWEYLYRGLLLPLGVILPACLAFGFGRGRRLRPVLGVGVACAVVPSLLFFAWYGEVNLGGYALGTAPIWSFLLMQAFQVWHPAFVGLLVITQAAAAWGFNTQADFVERREFAAERYERLDALMPTPGSRLVSLDLSLQSINGRDRGAREWHQWQLLHSVLAGRPLERATAHFVDVVVKASGEGRDDVYLDLTPLAGKGQHDVAAGLLHAILTGVEAAGFRVRVVDPRGYYRAVADP